MEQWIKWTGRFLWSILFTCFQLGYGGQGDLTFFYKFFFLNKERFSDEESCIHYILICTFKLIRYLVFKLFPINIYIISLFIVLPFFFFAYHIKLCYKFLSIFLLLRLLSLTYSKMLRLKSRHFCTVFYNLGKKQLMFSSPRVLTHLKYSCYP